MFQSRPLAILGGLSQNGLLALKGARTCSVNTGEYMYVDMERLCRSVMPFSPLLLSAQEVGLQHAKA